MAGNNGPKIIGYDPNTGAPIYSNPSSNSNKAIKGVIIGIIVAVIGVAGWFIYDTFFHLQKVDLFAYDDGIEVYGYSGTGVLEDCIWEYKGEYIGEQPYASEFYDTVSYEVDKEKNLSNGDTITITAKYDKALARKAKIKVKSDTKEYEVTGLNERYAANGSDIDPKDVAAMKSYMNDYMARMVKDNYNQGKSEGLEVLYYVSPTASEGYDEYEDMMIGIYKVSYKDYFDEETVVEFVPLTLRPINKGYDYQNEIDQLVKDGKLYLTEGDTSDSVGDLINEIKTEYNRDTVTEFE